MNYSLDIETALYSLLAESGYSASAHTIPAALGNTLPHIHVTRTGGFTSSRVMEFNQVDFDVYAATQGDAMAAASVLCGWVRDLEGTSVGSPCYSAEVTTLPYNNPDPRHPNLGRVTLKAQIINRSMEVNNA